MEHCRQKMTSPLLGRIYLQTLRNTTHNTGTVLEGTLKSGESSDQNYSCEVQSNLRFSKRLFQEKVRESAFNNIDKDKQKWLVWNFILLDHIIPYPFFNGYRVCPITRDKINEKTKLTLRHDLKQKLLTLCSTFNEQNTSVWDCLRITLREDCFTFMFWQSSQCQQPSDNPKLVGCCKY